MDLNFMVNQMTAIRYFLPLIIEGNSRGLKSNMFVFPKGKYNCPAIFTDQLFDLSKKYNFNIYPVENVPEHSGIMFFIESHMSEYAKEKNYKKVILTYMIGYSLEYGKYVDSADHIIFPSEHMEKYYSLPSLDESKHVCLGSPKYDVVLEKEEIYKKYDIKDPQKKRVLVVLPKRRDINKIDFKILYEAFKELNFEIISKTRGKDPFDKQYQGDKYVVDFSWFPHDTMEVMKISDVVINFGSTTIKECVMLKKPIINFNVKPFDDCFSALYNYDYCENFNKNPTKEQLKESINRLTSNSYEKEFDEAIQKYLFSGNSSKRILDFLGT